MTLTNEQMQRVSEIANGKFPDHEWFTPDDVKAMILTALSDPLLVGGWKPIESAPKDGTSILVMDNIATGLTSGFADKCWSGNTSVAAWWQGENNGEGAWVCYMSLPREPHCAFEPTHWRELPPPPRWE